MRGSQHLHGFRVEGHVAAWVKKAGRRRERRKSRSALGVKKQKLTELTRADEDDLATKIQAGYKGLTAREEVKKNKFFVDEEGNLKKKEVVQVKVELPTPEPKEEDDDSEYSESESDEEEEEEITTNTRAHRSTFALVKRLVDIMQLTSKNLESKTHKKDDEQNDEPE